MLNIGTGKYYNDPTKEACSDTPGYFTFCEVENDIAPIAISNPENLIAIPLAQEDTEAGVVTLATSEAGDGYTQYTTKTNVSIIFKMKNIDVAGCDYITFKFAEPVPDGLSYAFWNGDANQSLATGVSEFMYVFANDPDCAIENGIIPQVCLLTVFTGAGKVVKVKGVYKHVASENTYARTYSFDKALDFTDVIGLEAYVITAFNPTTATLTLSRVYQVPANTSLYLVGKDGDYEIPVIASADAIATNLLHASSGTDVLSPTDGSNTNLIFGGTGANRGFHPLSSAGVIGANKAYLRVLTADYNSIPSGARLNLMFEDETTGISATLNDKGQMTNDKVVYNLAGQRVAQPTKGLYIVNGKKVIIK